MIKVIPIQDKDSQRRDCEKCGASFYPELLAYAAYVDETDEGGAERMVGVCQFRMAPDGGHIITLDSVPGNEEFQPMFVMGRAALSFMDLCGAETGYFEAPVTENNRVLVGAVGFHQDNDGVYKADLRGFFDHPCSHGHATSGDK